MRRVLAGKVGSMPKPLEAKCQHWHDTNFPGFVKEFNRLRALEEGKGETPAGEGDSRPAGIDPGLQKAMDLVEEVKNKRGVDLLEDARAEERCAILGILDGLKKVGGSKDYNAALERVRVGIRDRMKVPAADRG
jgi:hypothetical protein